MDDTGVGTSAPPRSRASRGCLRVGLAVAGVALLGAVLTGVAGFVVLQIISYPETSGDRIDRRPAAATSPGTVPTSVPPGAEKVEPLPEDQMLVSVATGPPLNPCSGSGPDLDIEVMSLDGRERRRLPPSVNTGDEELWARLSPDRRRFVFYRSPLGQTGEHCRYFVQELWIANVDGSGVRPLFSSDQLAAVAREQGWPTGDLLQGIANWSPDGRQVVMVLGHSPTVGPLPLLNQGETQLFVLDVDGDGDLRQVTRRRDDQGRGLTSDPSFTPDGSTILFIGCPDDQPSCDDMQIRSVPADAERASTTEVVFDGPGRDANDVYVSPDGRSISWMEVGLLETRLFVSPFELGREVLPEELVMVDAHGGYANWTADSSELIYSRLWLTDRFALFANSFDGQPSRRLSPRHTSQVFVLPSP